MSISKIFLLLDDKNEIYGIYKNITILESTLSIINKIQKNEKKKK